MPLDGKGMKPGLMASLWQQLGLPVENQRNEGTTKILNLSAPTL